MLDRSSQNIAKQAVLIDEVKYYIADVAAGSLDRFSTAAKVIARFPEATPEQLLAAVIDLVREQTRRC